MEKVPVAVFISGNGTNLQALIEAEGDVLSHGRVAFVLSSNLNAYGLARAEAHSIPHLTLNEKSLGHDVFYALLDEKLRNYGVQFIVLAGYLPILAKDFVGRWTNRIINIHPSLLPKYGGKGFYGLRIHQAVLDNLEATTGASIHYVTESIDAGPIIAQQSIPVNATTAEELQKTVLEQVEWKLLPKTLDLLCQNYLANDSKRINAAILGSGGREHSLVRMLAKSPMIRNVVAIPGNDGMIEAKRIPVQLDAVGDLKNILIENKINFCIVGPEKPLSLGVVDELNELGIVCFGPSKEAAKMESSKVFAKEFMKRHAIPTAPFAVFDGVTEARRYLARHSFPCVIKADGLCGGKGVSIVSDFEEGAETLEKFLIQGAFGKSGRTIVVEDYLEGIEMSVMVLTDGVNYRLLPPAKDYKRAYDNDCGPNTGSMGALAPHPLWTESLKKTCVERIIEPTLSGMRDEDIEYRGCLYFGLMMTKEGPQLLEYNCRFGDPEIETILPLLLDDLTPILLECAKGDLLTDKLRVDSRFCCGVVLASKGYPGHYNKGVHIKQVLQDDIICSGVQFEKTCFVSNGGRVLLALGVGESKEEAINKAYHTLGNIVVSEGLFFRTDIGK